MAFWQNIKKFFIFYKTYTKGISKEYLGEYDKAIRELLFAISLKSDYIPVHKALIRLNKKNRNYQNALDYAERASEKFEQKSFFYAEAADLYRKIKSYNNAIEAYNNALKADDTQIDYYKHRAQIKYYTDDVSGAINDCNAAILREKKSADLFALRGFYNLELKNYISALEDYTKAIKLSPKHAHYYFMRSCCNELNGNTSLAEEDIQQFKLKSKSI